MEGGGLERGRAGGERYEAIILTQVMVFMVAVEVVAAGEARSTG